MRIKAITLVILSLFLFTATAQAKVLPQAKKVISKTPVVKVSGINVSPKLRSDRKAVMVNFSNLQNAQNVSYALIYNTSEQQEAAMGALNLGAGANQTQELLFGTCSKNVCRYHTGINNARLEVSYTLKSGKKFLKKYKIKV